MIEGFSAKKTTQFIQGLSMQEKIIKRQVVKQLKKDFPNWRRLPKKTKKQLAKDVLKKVVESYESQDLQSYSLSEMTCTPSPSDGIIPLNKMEAFIEEEGRRILKFTAKHWQKHYDDPELRKIDSLLDDHILNSLVAPEGYAPCMRDIFPCHYVRAELLKALRYPSMSYRNYCKDVINRMDSKRQRAFIHLPLHKKIEMDHTQLSHFRRHLTVSQLVNLTVYVVYLLIKSGKVTHPFKICGMDSTEVPVISCPKPLATVELKNGKKIRIYSELDADCGKRRKKRDKSEYFVGYRLHTLVAFDEKSGAGYPIVNLMAPANHHDKLFLPQLIAFASAMGLRTDIITADEGYLDPDQNENMYRQYGVRVITTASEKVNPPQYVDPLTGAVYMNGNCESPMRYQGRTDKGHEFGCDSEGCFHAPCCPQCREISLDSGLFGQIPDQVNGVNKVRDMRKNMERCFNLAKHREGLEPLAVKSQHSALAAATFVQMATLLIEIAGTRKTPKKKDSPVQLRLAV